ncbi:MAG: hypothetical protein QW292_12280, partial [Candidatus Parvarchaeota archaeon]
KEYDALKMVSNSVFGVELVPYHSEHFHDVKGLKSQEYAIELVKRAIVKRAIGDKKIIIIMNGSNHWLKKIPELKSRMVYKLKNPRNTKISHGNIKDYKGNVNPKTIMKISNKIISYWSYR